MEDFWKDDFFPLQWAGKVILQALRDDEDAADADLYRRLTQSQEGSHLYFRADASSPSTPPAAAPSKNAWSSPYGMQSSSDPFANASSTAPAPTTPSSSLGAGQPSPPPVVGLKHRQTLPLPAILTDALKQVRTCSLMGLLLPAQMAWMTVDERLFLFSAESPSHGPIQCFENPRKQPILAVALVKPKQGVFKEIVEWCLVVTTPEEAILLALARIDNNLKIIPTSFLMPTDLIQMACAVGTEDGRIFLGGNDGCVHEMVYEDETDNGYHSGLNNGRSVQEDLNQFYDGTKVLPDVVVVDPSNGTSNVLDAVRSLGKRAFQSMSTSAEEGQRKCRKLNRTTQASSVVTALVPNVIRQATTMVLGGPTARGGGRITRLCVDSERNTLYSLSEKGWIAVFDLTGAQAAVCVAVCDVPKTVRLYLEAVSRGQMFPPSSGSSTVGSIHFPGGGAAAQAGVGGMEGARNILKLAERRTTSSSNQQRQQRSNNSSNNHPIVTPVSLHVIPCQDSGRLTVMAVTGGGLRLYFSALSSSALSSGGPVSLNNGSRHQSFGTKLSLCHVRSPPPLNMANPVGAATWSADIAGGILPRVAGSNIPRVDASYYRGGQWVVAMEDANEAAASDVIVAATPDTAFRPREGRDGKLVSEATSGLAESIAFPIAASHESGQAGPTPRTLSGGLVWEIDSDRSNTSGALQLLMRSPTPSNAELDVGLPPVFYPPSQIRVAKNGEKPPSSDSRAIVPRNRVRPWSFQAIFELVLARPRTYGLYPHEDKHQGGGQPLYRVSKRTGLDGFSLSALERRRTSSAVRVSSSSTKQNQASKGAKSARLRQWLLQPPIKSLNQWTQQHLMRGKKVVTALNVQGLHKFEFDTVLSSLADALMAAGDNVSSDAKISSFFTGYGYKEGCAMCLALAIGGGPTEGAVGYSEELRRRASNAALARAHKPRLLREGQQVNALTSTLSMSNATDNCVPIGYLFVPSALSEGLCSLVSRLLRPIWHKPLVVVTEGRSLRMRWDSKTNVTSVKVELLLDDRTLEDIWLPLQNMLSLVKDVFSRAIDVVPGTLGQQHVAMEIDGGGEQQYFTQALQYHSQFRSSSGDSTELAPKECDSIAQLLEERNIHSMYRLVARAAQLLELVSLLRRSEGIAGLPQVDWGLLHGVTVSQLVQTSEGHDRLETLLNELVVATASNSSTSPMSAQADHLADQLAKQCYLYFPPSSRFTYQGLRLANEALQHPAGSSQRIENGKRAASQLIDAARHWQSASLISGRLVRGSGRESYIQIAGRAIQYSSPLARAVDLLIKLDDVSNVVEICLTASQNFKTLKLPMGPTTRYGGMLAWETDLYHRHSDARPVDDQDQTASSAGSQRSSEGYGTSVTANDAIDTCYALVFFHLDGLLRSNRPLADKMVSACTAVPDKVFLTSLFSFLVESSNVDTLLRVDSVDAETFLKKQSDPNLLWRYYSVLQKFVEAGHVAFARARSNDKLSLGERIEWLTKAASSYRSAQNAHHRPDSQVSDEELSKSVTETEDTLRVATLQDRIAKRIESLSDFPEAIEPSKFEELKTSLVQATSLYNDFAAKAPFFDLCLVIFHMCRHDDSQVIRNLWKNAICEKVVPCATRSNDTFQRLQEFVAEVDLADRVTLLADTMDGSDFTVFEDGDWVRHLQDFVVRMGKEVYGSGADYAFPVNYILEQLEILRSTQGSNLSAGWPLTTLAEAGVPYLVILDAYDVITQLESISSRGSEEGRVYTHAAAAIELFLLWVANSRTAGQSAGQHSAAHVELSRCMSTGDLMPKLNALRSGLEQMQGPGTQLLQQLNAVEDAISLL